MAATVSLEQSELSVEPGGTVTTTVRIRNTGRVVDNFSVEVLGPAGAWCTSEPASLNLFPGADGTVTVTAAPPRSPQVPARACPFGLKVTSAEDPAGSDVEEGVFHIGRFYDVTAELVPHTSRGRRFGIHDLTIDNRSNVLFNAAYVGSDPDGLLGFSFTPPVLAIEPGTAGFTRIRVRPRRRFWRGTPLTRPFTVEVRNEQAPAESATTVDPDAPTGPQPIVIPPPPAPAGPPPPPPYGGRPPVPESAQPQAPVLTADGSMLQEALLPGWLPQAIAAVVVLALLLTLLWFTLFKPQIKAAAKDQVSHQLAAAGIVTTTTTTPSGTSSKGNKPLNGAAPPATAPSGTSSPSGGGGGGASGRATGSGGASTATTGAGTAVDGRLAVKGNTASAYTVPPGKVLQLTDVDFQNPAGDTGMVILARNSAVLFQISMANFRDLDYHWISPIVFASGDQLQLIATGCANACTPGVYYAGYLANG